MTKEEIKQICQIYDNLRVERNTATIAYNSDDAFYEHILATYKLSQSSLPSNLDDAANRQAALEQPYKWEEEQDGSFGVTPLFVMSNVRSAFKAGAEWMAGQGGEIKGWLARHRDGKLCLFFNKPEYKLHIGWVDEHQHWRVIDTNLFPEIKFKNSPTEVIINIHKK